MNVYEIIPLFSVPVFAGNISIDCQIILDTIIDLNYRKYSNSGYCSENQNILDLRELSFLKKEIDKLFNIYLHEVLMYQKTSDFNFLMETSWVNLHKPKDFAPSHCHKNSMYSFVFYVDVGDEENSGDIVFTSNVKSTYSNGAFDIPISSYNVYNSLEWRVKPKNNMILIFPSHLDHCVTENQSRKDRYSIAGNYFCRGLFKHLTLNLRL
jgi:uncharacterized protein (TIGR02466 family)